MYTVELKASLAKIYSEWLKKTEKSSQMSESMKKKKIFSNVSNEIIVRINIDIGKANSFLIFSPLPLAVAARILQQTLKFMSTLH